MKKNNFDTIIDYIDRNISKEPEEIKKGIAKENGYGSNGKVNVLMEAVNKRDWGITINIID